MRYDLGNPNGVASMKKIFLTAVALTALVAAPAIAADMGQPVYRAPQLRSRAPVYGFGWTGCYIGGHIGGLWAQKNWFDHDSGSATFGLSDGSHDPSGFLGGLQAGCDYQFAGGFVIGIRATTPGPTPKAANSVSCSPVLLIIPR